MKQFHSQKIANIAPKHLYAYIDHLTKRGLSATYIKTELSAIRFYHDQIPGAKYQLPDNAELELDCRSYRGVDRTWSNMEFSRFVAKAVELNREDYATILCLGRYAALRIHECFRLDTAAAEQALNTGTLTIRGKGGLVRQVPINDTIRIELQKMLAITQRGGKLFVSPYDKTHLAIHRLENFSDTLLTELKAKYGDLADMLDFRNTTDQYTGGKGPSYIGMNLPFEASAWYWAKQAFGGIDSGIIQNLILTNPGNRNKYMLLHVVCLKCK